MFVHHHLIVLMLLCSLIQRSGVASQVVTGLGPAIQSSDIDLLTALIQALLNFSYSADISSQLVDVGLLPELAQLLLLPCCSTHGKLLPEVLELLWNVLEYTPNSCAKALSGADDSSTAGTASMDLASSTRLVVANAYDGQGHNTVDEQTAAHGKQHQSLTGTAMDGMDTMSTAEQSGGESLDHTQDNGRFAEQASAAAATTAAHSTPAGQTQSVTSSNISGSEAGAGSEQNSNVADVLVGVLSQLFGQLLLEADSKQVSLLLCGHIRESPLQV